MSSSLVVDASVAIKWIVPEEDSVAALALPRQRPLIAPQLIYAECGNILWKKVRRSELSGEEARKALEFVDILGIQTVSLRELAPTAFEISLFLDHPVYDCYYLALACIEDCPFVTADKKFHRRIGERMLPEDARRCQLLGA